MPAIVFKNKLVDLAKAGANRVRNSVENLTTPITTAGGGHGVFLSWWEVLIPRKFFITLVSLRTIDVDG